MSKSKGARLYLQPDQYRDGKLDQCSVWVIRDGARKIRTGCAPGEREAAEEKLGEYLASKYKAPTGKRHPSQILTAEVLNFYLVGVVNKSRNPNESKSRILKLAEFFDADTLDKVNGEKCRAFVAWRTKQFRKACRPGVTGNPALLVTVATARRELDELRAAINFHRREGHCSEIVAITLPEKSPPRDVWLKRNEMAKLIMAAWQGGQKHIARFILVGRYTGSRSGAICAASLVPAIGRGHVDLETGVFQRRVKGAKETNKRQTTIRLPQRLLAHMRRWERLGLCQHAVIEWRGKPIAKVRKGFASAAKAAGLPTSGPDKVTPHTLRHTAAPWGMQHVKTTSDVYELAGYLGMSYEVLMEVHGHHCPEFQAGATAAITGKARPQPGQNPDRLTVNKTR